MNLCRSARAASLFLTTLLFITGKFTAFAATVPTGACLYALDPSADRAFQIAGAQSVYTACGVVVESSASDGFEMEGAETLYLENHAQVSVVGGVDLTGQTELWDTISNKQVQAVKVASPGDPLASITPPATGTIVSKSPVNYNMNSKPANNTIQPGVYCGGMTIGNTNGTTYTMSPGVYIMAGGGLTMNSLAQVTGIGVTVYNTSSAGWGCSSNYNYTPISISGQVTATLSAPTSGAYDGILFFGNRAGCSTKGSCVDQINGGSTTVLNGALYFASDEIMITGSNASGYMILVADKIYINGNSTFGNNGNPFDGITVSILPSAVSLTAGQTQQFNATVNYTANPAVTWSISPALGSVSSTGLYTAPSSVTTQQTVTVTATSQADDTKAASATVTLTLAPITQTITFPALSSPVSYGVAPIALSAAGGASGNPVTFTVLSGPGTISGTTLIITGAGTVIVAANQTGNANYAAAAQVTQSVVVIPAVLTVKANNASRPYGVANPTFTDTIKGFVNGDPSTVASGTASLSTTATFASAVGTYPITAAAGTLAATNYTFAFVAGTLTVSQTSQAISFSALTSPVTYGVAPIALSANASSGLSVTFSVISGPGTITGSTLSITGVGTVVVAANQVGNTNYAAASQVTQTVVVNQATPTVTTWPTASAINYGQALSTSTLTGSVTSTPGTFSWTTPTTMPATGTDTESVTFTPTDSTDYKSVTGTINVVVSQATPTVTTWPTASAITYGQALSSSTLTGGVSSVAGTFTWTSPATIPATGIDTESVTFTPTDSTDYKSITGTVSVVVSQATPTVTTWPTASAITSGQALSSSTLSGGISSIPGAFTWTAPATVPATGTDTESVTFTPTDAADYSTVTGTISVTVNQTTQCASNGYSYQRAIDIDHTKVPNTDQANFPFLFNTTDPLLASTAYGGHVTSPNGYDIIFTSDPAGQNILNFEMEEYNPNTGQVIAWVNIPALSHSADTVIYVFYGNPSVNTPQQNPTGVWDTNYVGVWHVANNGGQLALTDSTSNSNNATNNGATSTAGQIDGGMQTDGSTYATIQPSASLANITRGNATFSAWVNPANDSFGGIMGKDYLGWSMALEGSRFEFAIPYPGFYIYSNSQIAGGTWSYLTVTLTPNQSASGSQEPQATMYINGVSTSWSGGNGTGPFGDDSAQPAYLGAGPATFGFETLNASEDEFRISNVSRSPDWIATEYANQSAPSAFYALYPENTQSSVPTTAILYPGQTEQFTFTGTCPVQAVAWTMPASAPGSITSSGLYTAPAIIGTEQILTVSATSVSTGAVVGSSTVTLMPPITVTVSPASPTLYVSYENSQFTATVVNAANQGVTWTANLGTISASGLYQAPSFNTPETDTITATSQADPTKSASVTVTLTPLTVAPYVWELFGGFSQQFTASVPVSWSLSPANAGTISATGLFTAPVNITSSQYLTITATSLNDPNASYTEGFTLSPPATITPLAATLIGGQTAQFSTCMATSSSSVTCGSSVAAWSISPAGAGMIDSNGLYTAPPAVPSQQTVVITATDLSNPLVTISATATLIPPVVTVSPGAATLYGGQTEQFFAQVTNSSNTAVTWSISPAGVGNINSSGFYSAPLGITSQQTVTITASSQAAPSVLASAVITLSPTQCAAKAYSYVRSIVIDHTKVPNTDQTNFPFLFSATDPAFASVANGGHVASANGYDIVFSSDTAGINRLDYEIEEYNAGTGQILAWVRIPTLTHAGDTVIYMFYGNPNVTASQQNPGGVWENNYQSVYHLSNAGSGTAIDSTGNGNSVPTYGLTSAQGDFDAAAGFNGTSSYIELPSADFSSYPTSGQYSSSFDSSFGIWFKTTSEGVILGQMGGSGAFGGSYVPALYVDSSGSLRGSFFSVKNSQTTYTSVPQLATQTAYNDNQWHFAAITYGNGTETLYVDGQAIGSNQNTVEEGYNSQYGYSVGTGYDYGWTNVSTNTGWDYFNGALEEVEVSSTARSADWLQAEYYNQSSPATFFALSPEVSGGLSLNPLASTLYAGQSQQFTILDQSACGPGSAVWSMPAGSLGVLSSEGLYTAPASIDAPQTVNITATTLGAASTSITAAVTLLPPVTINVMPSNVSLAAGQLQQFIAAVNNTSNTAVGWTISPAGVGTITTSGLYTAPATSTVQTVVVTATSTADTTRSASATITLAFTAPPVSVSVSPLNSALYGGQSEQLSASVSNTNNTAVTWTINSAGVGTVSVAGVYTAPATISTQQRVTITATSQADPSISANLTIELLPTPCSSNGYSYVRAITIDHTKVSNTDQSSFPFLFNTTDPLLASTANGGHVTSSNGNDIIFTSDPAGQNVLNYELEGYNPATGQVIAWVSIPTLSHSADTVLYMFYGNANITASLQNPSGVWDTNYTAVYHLANVGATATDSTVNGNNGTLVSILPAAGQIDGAASFNGSSSYIQIPTADFASYPTSGSTTAGFSASFGAWFQTAYSGAILGQDDGTIPSNFPSGWVPALYVDSAGIVRASMFSHGSPSDVIATTTAYNDMNWHFAVDTYANGVETLYVDGQAAGSQQVSENSYSTSYGYQVGTAQTFIWPGGNGNWLYFNGNLDEINVSNIARSGDWIATEYNNQISPSIFYSFSTENDFVVSPSPVNIYESQAQQFAVTGVCNTAATWTMSSGAPGTLTAGGLYTAPAVITTQQTVTITATSQATPTNTASAIVTLMPPVSVSVTPATLSLSESQNQLFTATVANSANQTVIWAISPAGVGTIGSDGDYSAPSSISAPQTVTITATSQEDSTKSASATITLAPTQCASIGYGYQRVIVIDHNKVANSDQANFPFMFSTTDPDLASTAYGGHVTNASGDDIFFSTDPNGQTKLDYEMEEYNQATGQVIAWLRIPTLSHTTDTLIYVFYGNPNITASQQNPTGVWNGSYQAVYHLAAVHELADVINGPVADSTAFANTGATTSVSQANGLIDGAGSFNGSSSFVQVPSADFPSFPTGEYDDLGLPETGVTSTPFAASFGMWFKTSSPGGLLGQVPAISCGVSLFGYCFSYEPTEPGYYDPASWNSMLYVDDNGFLVGGGITTSTAYDDNKWHYAAVTYANDGTDTLYIDGQLQGVSLQQFPVGYSPAYNYFVGTAYTLLHDDGNWNWLYFNGTIDEVTVTNNSLSGDWIQTQYNNQSSPSTFYQYTTISSAQVVPATATLYASQTQQFAVPGTCNGSVVWSTPSGAVGSISASGLYTAPSNISSQQTVSVVASNQATGSQLGTAAVTLLAPPQAITLSATGQQPFHTGTTQSFSALVLDQQANPQMGVTVAFAVSGANSTLGSGTTNSNGIATFSYDGTNSGTDNIQATASISGEVLTSNPVAASWIVPVTPLPTAGVALVAPPTLGVVGLTGAFTDNTGSVIEPIAIGASRREFVVPAGATQLQLGVNSEYYPGDGGSGFTVAVNGESVSIPAIAMPWIWTTGGLNTTYQYGIYNPGIQNGILDGSAPVVATANLSTGEIVTVAYQSGLASVNPTVRPLVNANGDQTWTPGISIWQGTHFPTLYTTPASYPVGQPITFDALVTDTTGAPIPNVPITLNITGVNVQQLQATTDSTGTAVFLYAGVNAGTDTLEAQAYPAGGQVFTSNSSNVTWVNSTFSSSGGSLALSYFAVVNDAQGYVALASDASGNSLVNENLGFYIWGVDNFTSGGTTDVTGHSYFQYNHTDMGTYNLVAVETVNGNVIFSNPISGVWSGPQAPPSSNTITIAIAAQSTVTLGTPLQLNGTVTDSTNLIPTVDWSQVSGPGTVLFSAANQQTTTATFSNVGTYVVELSAADASGNSGSQQFTVTVTEPPQDTQGLIGSPLNGSSVSGLVPITVAQGVTLQSGTLVYYPANSTNSITVLNPNTTGSGTIGTLDTTTLVNGSYWIQLQGTDTSGESQYSLVLVTVAGNYKPGRITATVTDLVVPATGLAINIQRTYDSLNDASSSDFGYGWSLGINVNLVVDPAGDVTFILGGQRRTFYFAPQAPACSPLVGCLFPFYFSAYTPEPGLHGTLSAYSPSCPIGTLLPSGNLWICDGTGTVYTPTTYTYTDSSGTSYNMSAAGSLQSIQDLSGNGLTITANGITSTTGLSVPFVRDAQNRITQITDPQGNIYSYGYDSNGNLATVTYPATAGAATCTGAPASNTSQYTYHTELPFPYNHLYEGGTDGRCNPLPTSSYYGPTDVDASGNSLNGRLESVTDALGETTSYAYNVATNTTTITYPPDASGNTGKATMVYDSYGMLLSSTDPLGHTTTNTYDTNHNLLSVTDPLGHVNSYTYDSKGNKTSATYPATSTSVNTTGTTAYNQYSEPTSTTDELGNVRTFNYDSNYLPQSITDSLGTVASFQYNSNSTLSAGAVGYDLTVQPAMAGQFSYDANGNLSSRTDALGRTTSFAYDSLGHTISMTVPSPNNSISTAGATTIYQYDATGNLIQTSAPLSRTTSSTYDANGNVVSSTDARGSTTSYQYDALNRLIQTTYPTQPVTTSTTTYDFRNRVVDSTDQSGNVTHHVYDLDGRLLKLIRGYGSSNAITTSYTYYNDGRTHTRVDALGHTTTYTYDAAGRTIAVTTAAGTTQYGYDDAGNRISTTDAKGNVTQFQYDARKRLVKTIYPDGTTASKFYDGPGNLISATDQAGNTVQYTYDAANELKTVVQLNHPNPSNNTNSYSYDVLGNITGLTDENLHTTLNSFDLFNEPVSKTLPDGTLTESRSYDPAGNLLSLTHFNGKTTTYTYDSLNRLVTRTPDPSLGETQVVFTYTAAGKRQTMTDASGQTTYGYDNLNRLTSVTTQAGTLNYTYDAAGNLASMASSNPNGASVTYTHDELNRLATVVDNRLPAGANTTIYSYDPVSNLATVTYPNGLQSTFTYDQLNRLTELSTSAPSSLPVADYKYTLGPTGIRTSATEQTGRALNWNYDGIYRLTNETVANDPAQEDGSVGYSLDPVGNRLSDTSSLSGISPGNWSYNADDEINTAETYDANGNTLTTGGKSFSYDSENRLTSMNGGAVTLLYDGDGNLVAKTVNGVTTRYLVDRLNPTGRAQVVEELINGAVQREYTYGRQRISENLNPLVTGNSTWTASFYGYDGAGSVRQLSNSAGQVTDTYSYDAFGNQVSQSGATPNSYLYRGERYDADLGFYYLRARWYNPVTGRFLTRDPANGSASDPGSLHKYLYANGDPVNRIDPSGRASLAEWARFLDVTYRLGGVLVATANELICTYSEASSLLAAINNATLNNIFWVGVNFTLCEAHLIPGEPGGGGDGGGGGGGDGGGGADGGGGGDGGGGRGPGGCTSTGVGCEPEPPPGPGQPRGIDPNFGGIYSSSTNAVGGTVWTTQGNIGLSSVEAMVGNSVYNAGEINVISGIHGYPDGSFIPDVGFYNEDVAAFADVPNVNVYDFTQLTPDQITEMLNGPGTTIGAFCDSGAVFAPYW